MRLTPVVMGLLVLALITTLLLSRTTRRETGSKATPSGAYEGLRRAALTVDPNEIGVSAAPTTVWGVIMDLGVPSGTATLVCFVDGSTSLYLSNGGGILGEGYRENVRNASKAFLEATARIIDQLKPTTTYPLPPGNEVRIYVRVGREVRTAEASDSVLREGRHFLSAPYMTGLRVLASLPDPRGYDSPARKPPQPTGGVDGLR